MTDLIEFDQDDFDRELFDSAVADGPPELRDSLLHVLGAGGKRLRPLLVHHFGGLVRADPRRVRSLGLAVELLHVATLIHDDIIDSAESRRGVDSLHRKSGSDVALLVGDLYLARCGVHLAATSVPQATDELFTALGVITRGELQQRSRRFDLTQGEADYLATIWRKTGSLIVAACAAAVSLGEGGPAQVQAARRFGHLLGQAFQIVDDVLDYTASAQELGKPAQSDIREGTVTLPLIYALQVFPAPLQQLIQEGRNSGNFSAVVEMVRTSGAIERCLVLADELGRQAAEALAAAAPAFVAGPHLEQLRLLTVEVARRRH